MSTSEPPFKQPSKKESDKLWVPALIIGVAFVFSIAFVFKTMKSYKRFQTLLINPSSVETPAEIAFAVSTALFPLKQRAYGVKIGHLDDDEIALEVASSISKKFPKSKKEFMFHAYKVSLNDSFDINEGDCRNTALFNLKRKPKRKWKKKIYFVVCTEIKEAFSLFYIIK